MATAAVDGCGLERGLRLEFFCQLFERLSGALGTGLSCRILRKSARASLVRFC